MADDFDKLWEQSKPAKAPAGEDFDALWDQAKPTSSIEGPGRLEALTRGGAQGLTLGFSDEITGGALGAWDALTSDATLADAYTRHRDEARGANEAAKAAHGGLYTAGEVGGGVASMFIPGLGIAKGAKLGAVLGKSAAGGALAGLGTSEEESLGGMAADTALGGALGVGAAGLGGAVGSVVSGRAAQKAGESLTGIAERQAAKAAGVNRSALKRIARKDNGVQEFGRALLDENVVTPFATPETIAGRARSSLQRRGEQIGGLLDEADAAGGSFGVDDFIARTDRDVLAPLKSNPFQKGAANQLDEMLANVSTKYGDQTRIGLGEANQLKGQLDDLLYGLKGTQDPTSTTMKAELSKVRGMLNEGIESGVGQSLSPEKLEQLRFAKRLYGWLNEASRSADDLGQREMSNRFFSPSDYGIGGLGGVGIAAATMNPATVAAGIPLAVGHRLVRKYGNQAGAALADSAGRWLSAPTAMPGLRGAAGDSARAGITALRTPVADEMTGDEDEAAASAARNNHSRMFPNLNRYLGNTNR